MVGHSKILDIKRNGPDQDRASLTDEDYQAMVSVIRHGEPDPLFHEAEPAVEAAYAQYAEETAEFEAHPARPWKTILAASLIGLLTIGWTGYWVWAHMAEVQAIPAPARIAELIGNWAMPMALLSTCWLLIMRNSAREAQRFADVSASLRDESMALEQRIRAVNGEIALARSFLAENARELEAIGRTSAAQLTDVAQTLVSALADSDQKAQMLERVSNAAVSNLELLRNHLPVVTSAAKDATNQIGNAGQAANDQINHVTAAMRDMGAAASSSAASVEHLQQKAEALRDNLARMTGEAAEGLENATRNSEALTLSMLERLSNGIADAEQRLGDTSENLGALTESNAQLLSDHLTKLQSGIETLSAATTQHDQDLSVVISRLDASLVRSAEQLTHIDADADSRLSALTAKLSAAIDDCDQRLTMIDSNATDRIAKLAFAISALSESSSDLAVNLADNEQRAATMVNDAAQLLQTLGAVGDELSETLPAAIAKVAQQLDQNDGALARLRKDSDALVGTTDMLATRLSEVEAMLVKQRELFDTIVESSNGSLTARQDEIEALAASLNATNALIADVSATADDQLTGSLRRVAEAAKEAAESSKSILMNGLADIGPQLAAQNSEALQQAIDQQLAGLGEAVSQAISRNLQLSDEAASRVSRQLRSINELTTNLEQRVADARADFDGIDDEAFARRIALLTESLNSAAIDVAKILSNEVTDTAWAAYLKGDRGVFTRRAVRLLDSGEARIIASHYDDDAEFRDHVNRYIHDFEAMMRVLLSTRDGNAIGVTLLSSDVGKLYVALAQAIDRLRG